MRIKQVRSRYWWTGTLARLTPDTISLNRPRLPVEAFPLDRVEVLQVSRGRKSNTGPAIIAGMVAGGFLMNATHGCVSVEFCALEGVVITGLGAIGGGLLGLMIGSATTRESWVDIDLELIRASATPPRIQSLALRRASPFRPGIDIGASPPIY